MSNANSRQVGGDHYRAAIQHWDFVSRNRLGYLEGCATKYGTRWQKKDGKKDLEKAVHYVDKLIESYREGFVSPRTVGTPTPISVSDFCESNGLGTLEAEFTQRLTYWEHAPDLLAAKEILNQLIATA